MPSSLSRSADVPLVYRAPASTRWLAVILGSVLTIAGLASALVLLCDWSTSTEADTTWFATVCITTLGAGVATLATTLRYQLTLMPETLILRSAWQTRAMQRSDIAGYRSMSDYGGDILIFISKSRPANGVAVKLSFKTDAAFAGWMEGIPNLDAA